MGGAKAFHGKMADHPSVELIVSVSESLTAAGYFFRSLCLIYSRMVEQKKLIFQIINKLKQVMKKNVIAYSRTRNNVF